MQNFQDKDLISMFWRIIGRMEKLSEMKPFLAGEMNVPQSIQDKVSKLSSQLFNLTDLCGNVCADVRNQQQFRTFALIRVRKRCEMYALFLVQCNGQIYFKLIKSDIC